MPGRAASGRGSFEKWLAPNVTLPNVNCTRYSLPAIVVCPRLLAPDSCVCPQLAMSPTGFRFRTTLCVPGCLCPVAYPKQLCVSPHVGSPGLVPCVSPRLVREEERFRREIGHVDRDFQRYLRTGEVAQRLSERKLDFGRPSFDDKLSWQVVNWDRQWQALARLEARMKDVD